jgi:hypothetical protein
MILKEMAVDKGAPKKPSLTLLLARTMEVSQESIFYVLLHSRSPYQEPVEEDVNRRSDEKCYCGHKHKTLSLKPTSHDLEASVSGKTKNQDCTNAILACHKYKLAKRS